MLDNLNKNNLDKFFYINSILDNNKSNQDIYKVDFLTFPSNQFGFELFKTVKKNLEHYTRISLESKEFFLKISKYICDGAKTNATGLINQLFRFIVNNEIYYNKLNKYKYINNISLNNQLDDILDIEFDEDISDDQKFTFKEFKDIICHQIIKSTLQTAKNIISNQVLNIQREYLNKIKDIENYYENKFSILDSLYKEYKIKFNKGTPNIKFQRKVQTFLDDISYKLRKLKLKIFKKHKGPIIGSINSICKQMFKFNDSLYKFDSLDIGYLGKVNDKLYDTETLENVATHSNKFWKNIKVNELTYNQKNVIQTSLNNIIINYPDIQYEDVINKIKIDFPNLNDYIIEKDFSRLNVFQENLINEIIETDIDNEYDKEIIK
jgi:hypothetical protein